MNNIRSKISPSRTILMKMLYCSVPGVDICAYFPRLTILCNVSPTKTWKTLNRDRPQPHPRQKLTSTLVRVCSVTDNDQNDFGRGPLSHTYAQTAQLLFFHRKGNPPPPPPPTTREYYFWLLPFIGTRPGRPTAARSVLAGRLRSKSNANLLWYSVCVESSLQVVCRLEKKNTFMYIYTSVLYLSSSAAMCSGVYTFQVPFIYTLQVLYQLYLHVSATAIIHFWKNNKTLAERKESALSFSCSWSRAYISLVITYVSY